LLVNLVIALIEKVNINQKVSSICLVKLTSHLIVSANDIVLLRRINRKVEQAIPRFYGEKENYG